MKKTIRLGKKKNDSFSYTILNTTRSIDRLKYETRPISPPPSTLGLSHILFINKPLLNKNVTITRRLALSGFSDNLPSKAPRYVCFYSSVCISRTGQRALNVKSIQIPAALALLVTLSKSAAVKTISQRKFV